MDPITRLTVTAHVLVGSLVARARRAASGDEGQASTEYAGVLFVIVAIIAALIGIGFTEVGQAIVNRITAAVGQVGNP